MTACLPRESIQHQAVNGARTMLAALGIHGDELTPDRLVRALDELTYGRSQDPRRHLAVQFPPTSGRPDYGRG